MKGNVRLSRTNPLRIPVMQLAASKSPSQAPAASAAPSRNTNTPLLISHTTYRVHTPVPLFPPPKRMDQPVSSLDQNVDLAKLSQKDKQELQQFIVNESQKARVQQCMFFPFLTPSPSFSVNFPSPHSGTILAPVPKPASSHYEREC